jgi:hypothetical protein
MVKDLNSSQNRTCTDIQLFGLSRRSALGTVIFFVSGYLGSQGHFSGKPDYIGIRSIACGINNLNVLSKFAVQLSFRFIPNLLVEAGQVFGQKTTTK